MPPFFNKALEEVSLWLANLIQENYFTLVGQKYLPKVTNDMCTNKNACLGMRRMKSSFVEGIISKGKDSKV